jgi:hypothetical protein
MFAKLSYTWELMGASWDVLKRDKKLVVFPLMSGICCLIVLASFAVPFIAGGHWKQLDSHQKLTQAQQVMYWATLFLFYFANYFVITFFNSAIIACAIARMAGGEPTVSGGFREAMARIHLIAGWALLAATVGLVLRIVEERSSKAGAFVASILGAVWTVMTFLVVPVIVMENLGPIAALKQSSSLLKKTWGEQLVGNSAFGLLFFLLNLPGVAIIVFGVMAIGGNAMLGGVLIGVGVLYMIALALIHSALTSIYQAAIYMYTQGITDDAQGFPVKLLKGAMTTA